MQHLYDQYKMKKKMVKQVKEFTLKKTIYILKLKAYLN